MNLNIISNHLFDSEDIFNYEEEKKAQVKQINNIK